MTTTTQQTFYFSVYYYINVKVKCQYKKQLPGVRPGVAFYWFGLVETGGQDGLPLLLSNGVARINHGRSGMGVAKAGIHRAGDAAGAQ